MQDTQGASGPAKKSSRKALMYLHQSRVPFRMPSILDNQEAESADCIEEWISDFRDCITVNGDPGITGSVNI